MRYALILAALTGFIARADVPFIGTFKFPAEKRIWQALNEPKVDAFELPWKPVDPTKDSTRPDDFWRQWPAPFSGFYAGAKIPAGQFALSNLYHDGKFFYPVAQYDPNADYVTFLDLHESLAWLYAFDSPANPLFRNRALRLRAEQLALVHLIYMVQECPAGNIIGGYPIQYGNCVAWNARVLRWLDETDQFDPELKAAWLACLDYVLTTLDGTGTDVLQTGMGHWNLWPVVGAFELWKTSKDPKHLALFEKWAKTQLSPDAFSGRKRFVSGMSPCGYVRYSGIDLGYNGQAKNWMVPVYFDTGPDSIVGDFARREYQFASFVSVEEPDGRLSSVQHMNSHSPQSTPYEQWSFHKHMVYAMDIPDARPFAVRAGFAPTKAGGRDELVARQTQMEGMKIKMSMMAMGVRSYPSNYLHLPAELAWYPKGPAPDLSMRTRPMEHVAYAKWFQSPVERDEFFVRRMPAYHATIYSGPCRKEISNLGGTLNSLGAGGLGQLWIQGAGTMLMAATDLVQKPSLQGDFEKVWSQLAINGMVGVQPDGKIACTGWTGSLMEADAGGENVTIHDGLAPGVRASFGTPMTGKVHWSRKINFSPEGLAIEASIEGKFDRLAELLPVAIFHDTEINAVDENGGPLHGPWAGVKRVKAVIVHRGKGTMGIMLERPLAASWGEMKTGLVNAVGEDAVSRSLQIWLDPGVEVTRLRYQITLGNDYDTPVVMARPAAVLPAGKIGAEYRVALESPDAQAVYWQTSGKLPAGLTLNRNGLLSGMPGAAGDYKFTVSGTTPYKSRPFFMSDLAPVEIELTVRP